MLCILTGGSFSAPFILFQKHGNPLTINSNVMNADRPVIVYAAAVEAASEPATVTYSATGNPAYLTIGNLLFKTINAAGVDPASSAVSLNNGTGMTAVTAIVIHPKDQQKKYVAMANGTIWFTSSGGATWIDITGDFPRLSIISIGLRDDMGTSDPWLFVATSTRIYVAFAQNANTQWQQFGKDLPDIKISYFKYNKATGRNEFQ